MPVHPSEECGDGVSENQNTVEVRELFTLLKENFARLLFFTALGALAAMVVSMYALEPIYEATARLYVNASGESASKMTSDQMNASRLLAATYAVILKDNDVLMGQVIDALGVVGELEPETLSDMISAEPLEITSVMQVALRAADARFAYLALDEIVKRAQETLVRTTGAGSVEVVKAAGLNPKPVSPRLSVNVGCGAIFGFALPALYLLVKRMYPQ
jgi:capsular polysaccharide biosynthesis protein